MVLQSDSVEVHPHTHTHTLTHTDNEEEEEDDERDVVCSSTAGPPGVCVDDEGKERKVSHVLL